ncbi:MAG: helix-turn-helix domain-containing protein [Actinomycetota bacterium]
MGLLSVSQAAPRLGISDRRVRQMLERGEMEGQRVGWSWVIDSKAIDVVRRRPLAGRRWSPEAAWALLLLANGEHPNMTVMEASRAKHRLTDHDLDVLVMKLASRGEIRKFYGHKSILQPLADERMVVRSGVSAAREHNADIIALEFLEAYVPVGRIEKLVKKYALESSPERPNILFRIVDDKVWPFPKNVKVASRVVVAVDLLDSDNERTRRAGAGLARLAWPSGRDARGH